MGKREKVTVLLSVVLALSLAACSARTDAEPAQTEETTIGEMPEELILEEPEAPGENQDEESSVTEKPSGEESEPEKADEVESGSTDEEETDDADDETADVKESEEEAEESDDEAEEDGRQDNWQDQFDNRIILATDIHYLAEDLTDHGSAFQEMEDYGDGKIVTYVEEITDAFLCEVIEEKPSVLILSGDLTLEGEKKSHEELAEQLYAVEDAGIPVLVIPGNHDINNRKAGKYRGTQRMPAEYTTPEEFKEIYADFGYNEAWAEDPNSLSYVYRLNEETWFLMIDSCKYRPLARVGGSVGNETYYWIERQLEAAWDANAIVVPVAHHNLLEESQVYVDDCTIEHGDQLADLFDNWDVSFFLSGHLHVQHYSRSDDNRGIWEIVTSSLATPTCKYGIMDFCHNGDFSYHTKSVDMESWAERTGQGKKDLLEFQTFQEPFLKQVFYNQSYTELSEIPDLTQEERIRMSDLYAELNYAYYQGTAYQIRDEILANPDYELWTEDGTQTILAEYVQAIIEDATKDYNSLSDD
ncbi:MAG: metallophosphoesterase [Clostridiales bacterium]|nr:metallophosphoesterase [Clostridiales bacterium]